MSRRYLTVAEVAAELEVTEYMVRAQHRRGALKGVRLGRLLRFEPEEVEAFTRRIREQAKPKPKPTTGLSPRSRPRK